jgi:hypothetical protein
VRSGLRPWVPERLQPGSDLFRQAAPTTFIDAAWDALEASALLADLSRVYRDVNQKAGRIVLIEERWRRPNLHPARYVLPMGKTAAVMQLEMGKNELRLAFRSGAAGGRLRWGDAYRAVNPLTHVNQERRLVLSLGALNAVPVPNCFGYLINGLRDEDWPRLCASGDDVGSIRSR